MTERPTQPAAIRFADPEVGCWIPRSGISAERGMALAEYLAALGKQIMAERGQLDEKQCDD